MHNLQMKGLRMSKPNKHTQKIHAKGYKVQDFLDYWGITRRTYDNYCANEKLHDKLHKMIEGMK